MVYLERSLPACNWLSLTQRLVPTSPSPWPNFKTLVDGHALGSSGARAVPSVEDIAEKFRSDLPDGVFKPQTLSCQYSPCANFCKIGRAHVLTPITLKS